MTSVEVIPRWLASSMALDWLATGDRQLPRVLTRQWSDNHGSFDACPERIPRPGRPLGLVRAWHIWRVLTPMLVQYVVGLCCYRREPRAVDVTIGDMVLDSAARKERDVDVTVTVDDSSGEVAAFKVYEVKREKAPLDVATVEGLCMKLNDMPRVTHKAIVSSSGFTDGAKAKAGGHSVELYVLEPWNTLIEAEFPGFRMAGNPQEVLPFSRSLLFWINETVHVVAGSGLPVFQVEGTDAVLNSEGAPHRVCTTFQAYRAALLLRSTTILYALDPAQTVLRTFPPDLTGGVANSPAWPHTHTLDVSTDEAYLKLVDGVRKLETVTINGFLQWQHERDTPEFYIMRRVADGEAFAGALIALGPREGQMFAFTISDSPTAGVHLIRLNEKHRNAIRKLKLDLFPDPA